MQRIIVADTSDVVRKVAKRILTELGFLVVEAGDAQQAIASCQPILPEFMIIDAGIESCLEVIAAIRAMPNGQSVRIYYCVIEADLKKLMAGKRAGATDFLQKPFDRRILTNVFGSQAATV
jgi:two-component system, chemotaxis family, chemotaxis protein CheY